MWTITFRHHPVFSASPDGISTTNVLEIKFSLTAKTKLNYINAKGEIVDKVKSQIQLQMAFSGRHMGIYVLRIHTSRNTKMLRLSPYPMMKNMLSV